MQPEAQKKQFISFPEQWQPVLAETKITLILGLPIIAAQLAQIALGFIDTVMAGNLSARDLAAIAIGRSLYVPIWVIILGILLAVNPICAQNLGAGKLRQIGKSVRQGLWLSQLLAIPSFFLVRHMEPVMHYMDFDLAVIPLADGYLKAVSWGIFPTYAYLVLRFFNDGISITRPHMYIAFAALPLNALGNYLLMYGKAGFPKLGAVGAGWATAAVWWLMLLTMTAYLVVNRYYRRFHLFSELRWPQWRYMKEVLHIGVPNGVSFGMEVSMFAIAALLIGTLGIASMAAHQIAINFASITFMAPLGLSIAATSRVGFAAGRSDLQLVRIAGFVGMGLSLLIMCVSALIMFSIPERIADVYTSDFPVRDLAAKLIILAAVFQLSDGLQVSASGALRGLKDTRVPMLVNIMAYWGIGLPLGYLLGIRYGMGPQGFWIGMIAGLTIAACIHPLRFYRLTRRAL